MPGGWQGETARQGVFPAGVCPVYRFPFGAHIILFKRDEAGVVIVRVFQARMDWLRLFEDG